MCGFFLKEIFSFLFEPKTCASSGTTKFDSDQHFWHKSLRPYPVYVLQTDGQKRYAGIHLFPERVAKK